VAVTGRALVARAPASGRASFCADRDRECRPFARRGADRRLQRQGRLMPPMPKPRMGKHSHLPTLRTCRSTWGIWLHCFGPVHWTIQLGSGLHLLAR